MEITIDKLTIFVYNFLKELAKKDMLIFKLDYIEDETHRKIALKRLKEILNYLKKYNIFDVENLDNHIIVVKKKYYFDTVYIKAYENERYVLSLE